MPVSDPLVMPTARELLECLTQEMAKVESPPLYVQLRSGSVVDHLLSTSQDECCQGLAWVRPSSFYPSSAVFPTQDGAPQPKGVGAWAFTLELGAVRCAPTPDETRIPTGEEWDAVTQAVMDDAAAMRRALCCWIEGAPNRAKRVLPGIWTPLDIEGGCVGGTLPVTFRGPACDCAEAGPESS
jgi:hypothetical protein